jgi:hypothetical protein
LKEAVSLPNKVAAGLHHKDQTEDRRKSQNRTPCTHILHALEHYNFCFNLNKGLMAGGASLQEAIIMS